MPFKSEKQRRFLHANEPEIAKRWEKDYENEEEDDKEEEDEETFDVAVKNIIQSLD